MAAGRVAPFVSRWPRRVFSVEMNGAEFYFALGERHEADAPRLFSRHLRGDERCYSLLVRSADSIRGARFYAQLQDALLRGLPPDCRLSPMCSFLPEERGSLLRGYFLEDPSHSPSRTVRLLEALTQQQQDALLVCSYRPDRDSRYWTQHLWCHDGEERVETASGLCVVSSEAPQTHPALLNIINSDVFYTFQDARDVFTQCVDDVPEASSVLELLPPGAPSCRPPEFPVIVVEGLDATGKTTLTESLRDALGAALMPSPPQCLAPWRACFDKEPPIIRRAFYALGNYVTAEEVGRRATKTPVIVDRFWHSTAAYAIATAVSGPLSNLPEQGSEVYRWPADLLQPSLVVLLTLDPEERTRRLRDRGRGKTQEEQELDCNQLFRLRVEEAYRRISGPACVVVDASPSADQLLQQVLLLIQAKCQKL